MDSSFYTSSSGDAEIFTVLFTFFSGIWLIALIFSLLSVISLCLIYKKANKPIWAVFIPVYNIYTLLQIVDLPAWYLLLLIIPFANIYATFKIYIELAHKFGKSTGFGIGLLFLGPIFQSILAFGSATYIDNENTGYQDNMTNMNNNINNNMNMNYQNTMNDSVNSMNNNMNTQPVMQAQTPVQNNTPVEPIVQNTNTSFELPEAEPAKQEFITPEPAAPVVENKFIQPDIEVPNAEPITDVKDDNVQ